MIKYICDTNFILRYLLADEQDMFIKTKNIFQQAKSGEIALILEQTVFTETIFVLSSFYKVPRAEISSILKEMLTYKGIQADKDTLLQALDYYLQHNIHIVDCILLAKAKISGLPLLSFDEELLNIHAHQPC